MFFKTKPTRGGLLRPIAHFFTILIFSFFKVVDEPILRLPLKNLGAKILGCRDIGISNLKQNLYSQGGAPQAHPFGRGLDNLTGWPYVNKKIYHFLFFFYIYKLVYSIHNFFLKDKNYNIYIIYIYIIISFLSFFYYIIIYIYIIY